MVAPYRGHVSIVWRQSSWNDLMSYVLIPDGFTLKKVTKPEQDAVDEYFGRERRKSYLNNLIDNPTTVTLAVSALTGVFVAPLIKDLFEEGITFTSDEIAEKLNPVTIINTWREKRAEKSGQAAIEEMIAGAKGLLTEEQIKALGLRI